MKRKLRLKSRAFFKGVAAEFKKIIWPDKMTLTKQTTAVLVVSIVLGVIIKIVDMLIQLGLSIIV
jgi:preprotein translocase subunit SecE